MSPQQLNMLYNERKEPIFDAVVSFSSIEHSGLGRYGEALNPWGDLITMAKAWCLTKLGGKFLIGKSNTCEEFYIPYRRKYYASLDYCATKGKFKYYATLIP